MASGKEWLLLLAKLDLGEDDAESLFETRVREHRKNSRNSDSLAFHEIDVSQNKIALRGCKAVVDVCLKCEDLRVVKLFKNNITDAASESICQLVGMCPGMEQLHLSYNLLTEKGAAEIIVAAHNGRVVKQGSDGQVLDRRDRGIPLWLRLEHNRIRRVQEALEELWSRCIDFCEARNAQQCGPRCCKRHALVHLPFFTKQHVDLPGGASERPSAAVSHESKSERPTAPLQLTPQKLQAHLTAAVSIDVATSKSSERQQVPPIGRTSCSDNKEPSEAQNLSDVLDMSSAQPPDQELTPSPEPSSDIEVKVVKAPASASSSKRKGLISAERLDDAELDSDKEQVVDENFGRTLLSNFDAKLGSLSATEAIAGEDGRVAVDAAAADAAAAAAADDTIRGREDRQKKENRSQGREKSVQEPSGDALLDAFVKSVKKTHTAEDSDSADHKVPMERAKECIGDNDDAKLSATLSGKRVAANDNCNSANGAAGKRAKQNKDEVAQETIVADLSIVQPSVVASEESAKTQKRAKRAVEEDTPPAAPLTLDAELLTLDADIANDGKDGTQDTAVTDASAAKTSATTSQRPEDPKPRVKGLAGLGDIHDLQKRIQEDHNKLKLFVIKAKQDWDDRSEKFKGETNDQEYYVAKPGEVLGPAVSNDYLCEANIGKGVFSIVYQCKNIKEGVQCAVKIIRSNHMMRRAAEKEAELCRRLMKQGAKVDSEGVQYIVKLIGQETFIHQGHMCMVFELLKCDLRTALHKYGRGKGLPLQTLQQYLKQIFLGLRMLRRLKIIHGDVKPDNILMSLSKLEVKICDFGTAMDVADQVSTSYAQPRHYRAPEVMVGLTYDTQIDVWSAGITCFELATGKAPFVTRSNNAMLRQMMDVLGPVSDRMATSGSFSSKHFNKEKAFLDKDPDSLTGEPEIMPLRLFTKPSKSLSSMMIGAIADPPPNADAAAQDRLMPKLADLVSKCLQLDPGKRFTSEQVVDDPFFRKDKKQ